MVNACLWMTVKAADDLYLAVHEACLDEGEPLKLKSEKGQCLFYIPAKAAFACMRGIKSAVQRVWFLRQSSGAIW